MPVSPRSSPKDHPETSSAGRQSKAEAEKADADNADQVDDAIERETSQGFRGVEVDPTPNENYTVQGVTSGAPTPETDADAAEKARQALADTAAKATGVSER